MTSVEDQKRLDRNIQRVGMFHALKKVNAIVQEVENERLLEAKAIKNVLVVLGVIGVVALFYVFVESGHIKPPPSTLHVASDRFTSYVDNWAKQVQAKLVKSCITFNETGNQSAGVILSTSIMKDGAVEKVTVTKSSGVKELDEAAVRGVLAAAPFAPLTDEIKRDTDILTITRTFRREPCPQK
jgi:TonB family protein